MLLADQGHDVEEHAEQAGVDAHVLAGKPCRGVRAGALLADHGLDCRELVCTGPPCRARRYREGFDPAHRSVAHAGGHPPEQLVMVPLVLGDHAHEQPHEWIAAGVGEPRVLGA